MFIFLPKKIVLPNIAFICKAILAYPRTKTKYIVSLLLLLTVSSCVKDKFIFNGNTSTETYVPYLYPYGSEAQNTTAEIAIELDKNVNAGQTEAYIPRIKYNKSWIFMFTQDDCKHAAYSCTWAAINGKPLTNKYYYNAAQLSAGDLPPDAYYLEKTFGSTDGAGNEVRFHFTTTVAPEWEWMDEKTQVSKGYKKNYYRFFMKSGLVWDNVKEMLNYGNSIAFHDVNASDISNPTEIKEHFSLSQNIILDRLSGRGCKVLAEPNGNKTYITAAKSYEPIRTMTAQSGAEQIKPFQVSGDLKNVIINRIFYRDINATKKDIATQVHTVKENRNLIYAGLHGTDIGWVNFLLWLNNTYGKDGDDSVWCPSQEEYYEYNHYRTHATVKLEQAGSKSLKLTVTLPSELYFYYPSVTINIKGLSKAHIASIISNDAVTGLSYGDYEDGVMLNIDCRKYLKEHATHYVEKYMKDRSNSANKADAVYFTNMLKDSPSKKELLEQIK